MKSLTLQPVSRVAGDVHLPGSKSISNRVVLLAALAEGTTSIRNLLRSDDTRLMLQALTALGVDWSTCEVEFPDSKVVVHGKGGALVTEPREVELFLGLAGTAIRPLTAALTLGEGRFTLDGEPRMRERPIGDLVQALTQLGAQINYLGNPGYPPVEVIGTGLEGGSCSLPGAVSSQFLTSLLMAAPLARHPVEVSVPDEQASKPYLDITLNLMHRFGIQAEHENYKTFHVPKGQYHSPGSLWVEGDASSATYFLAAGAIAASPDSPVRVYGIGSDSIQGDFAFIDVLRKMGAKVTTDGTWVAVSKGNLQGMTLDLNAIPDAAMTVALLAVFAEGTTRIENIANWRVKETDRLDAMARELKKLGAFVEEGENYLVIDPPAHFQSARIATYGDHRMAMCFSLAALSGVPVTIENPDCVAKTFPDYFEVFDSIRCA